MGTYPWKKERFRYNLQRLLSEVSRFRLPLCLFCNSKVDLVWPCCAECHEKEEAMRLLRNELAGLDPRTRNMSEVALIRALWERCIELKGMLEATRGETRRRT